MPLLRSMVRKLARAVDKTVHPDRIYMSADISVHSLETVYSFEEHQEFCPNKGNDVFIYPGSQIAVFEIYQDPHSDLQKPSLPCSSFPPSYDNEMVIEDSNITSNSTVDTNSIPFSGIEDAEAIDEDEEEDPEIHIVDNMLCANDFPLLKVSIRAKGRPVHNTTADRSDFSAYMDGLTDNNERRNDQRRIAEIAEEEAGRQRQQQEEIRAYQVEFPAIFDNDFVEILLSEEIVFDSLTNTSIIEEQLLITRNPNFISTTFQPYTYTHFNHGEENNLSTLINDHPQTVLSASGYYNLQERRYLTMQFRRYKNGWRPSSRVLYQLEDNELNRLCNSETTISVGIFNRIDFHDHRIVMFI